MAARKLRIRSATFKIDGEVVTVNQGDEVPDGVLDQLPAGALEPVKQVDPEDPPLGATARISGDYDDHNVDDLQAEADARGLTVDGTGKGGNVLKGDLTAALQADDAE